MNLERKTRRSSAWSAGKGRRPAWLSVLMLTFIIFVCLDCLPPIEQQNQQRLYKLQNQRNHQYLAAKSNYFTAQSSTARVGGRFVILASAEYLDSIGQISNVLSEFVNSVLEKISFLAEIVIESSLTEECLSPIEPSHSSPASQVASSCDSYARKHNLTSNPGQPASGAADIRHISRDKFDENEYKNVDAFLESYYHSKSTSNTGYSSGSGSERPTSGGVSRETGCKLFTLDVSQRDLPVGDMTICCNRFSRCYNNCGQLKLDCDQDFRQCLTTICKLNFDYKNATIIERNLVRLTKRNLVRSEYETLSYENDHDDAGLTDLDSSAAESIASSLDKSNESQGGRSNKRSPLDTYEPEADLVDLPPLLSVPPLAKNAADEDSGRPEGQTGLPLDDMDTKTTVKRLRDKYKACKLASKLMIIGNLVFSCQTYRQSQWRACCSSNAS